MMRSSVDIAVRMHLRGLKIRWPIHHERDLPERLNVSEQRRLFTRTRLDGSCSYPHCCHPVWAAIMEPVAIPPVKECVVSRRRAIKRVQAGIRCLNTLPTTTGANRLDAGTHAYKRDNSTVDRFRCFLTSPMRRAQSELWPL